MAKRGRSSSERGGCLWRLADFLVIGLIAWAIAWFGPWKTTTRPLLRDAWARLATLKRPVPPTPLPSPAAAPTPEPVPTTTPTPEPSPTAEETPVPVPTLSPTPEPAVAPTPEPAPELDDALARLQSPRLGADLSARADRVWETLGGVAGSEERSWRDNLACAADPNTELTAWEGIAEAYEAYCAKYPALPDSTRREIFQVLLMRTIVPEAHVTRFVRSKELRPEEVRGILQTARTTAGVGVRAAAAMP